MAFVDMETVEEISAVTDRSPWEIIYTIERILHAYRDEQEIIFEQVKCNVLTDAQDQGHSPQKCHF